MKTSKLAAFTNWNSRKKSLNSDQKKEILVKMFDDIGIEIELGKGKDINNPDFSARLQYEYLK